MWVEVKKQEGMKKVREGLYIGNFFDMCMVLGDDSRLQVKITHVLSLLTTNFLHTSFDGKRQLGSSRSRNHSEGDLVRNSRSESGVSGPEIETGDCSVEITGRSSQITRMKVPFIDDPTENLLDRLEACLDFIDKARERGTILVHCMAGVSRSAAVIVAYLMKTERLSVKDALSSLRKASSKVCPNKGFMEQLQMFEEMGYKIDPMHPVYKSFKASRTCLEGH